MKMQRPDGAGAATPFPCWRELYRRNEAFYRTEAVSDPFLRWEIGRTAESAEIDLMFGYGVTALLAGGDPELARALFARTVKFGERMRAVPAPSPGENYLLPVYQARNFACEVTAQLLVSGVWNAELYADGLQHLVEWCFELDPPIVWNDMISKPFALRAIRMALVAGRQDVFLRFQRKMKRMKPIDEMPLWRAVEQEPVAGRQAQLVRDCIDNTPKGGAGTFVSADRCQFELALVYLRLANVPFAQITPEAIVDVVWGRQENAS